MRPEQSSHSPNRPHQLPASPYNMATSEQPETPTPSTIPGDVTNTSLVTLFYNVTNTTTSSTPSNYFETYVTQYLYIGIGSLGMLGNLFVLVVIFSVPAMRKKLTNIYIINQSFIDFCVSFFLAASASAGSYVPYSGMAGIAYCKVWSNKLFLWGFLVSSTYNLVALTVERYLEVVHPIWHKLNFNHKKAYISVAFVWVFGPVFNAAYMIPSSVIKDGACSIYSEWPTETGRKIFGVFTVFLQYLIPLGILIFSYGRIILRLTRKVVSDKKTNPGTANTAVPTTAPKEDHFQRAKRNTVKTLCIVAFCFVLCWTWNQIYYLMMNLGYPDDYTSGFYHFTVVAVFLNCCINPFIYSLKYEQFQHAAKKMFCKRCMKKEVGDNSSSTAMSEVNE